MTILDRYLLLLFLRTFVVCFLSFTGLYVVIHLFSNLDELSALSTESSWAELMLNFYGPRVAEMFGKTAPVLALVAGIFSISMLQRNRELTAIEAGGITKLRALRSIIFAGLVIVALTVANRELLIPKFKDRLVRTPQNWHDRGKVSMSPQEDLRTGMKFRGKEFYVGQKKITEANVQLPLAISTAVPRIAGDCATLIPANEVHPEGLLFEGVTLPPVMTSIDSILFEQQPLVFSPKNFPWLAADQCFVAVKMNADEIAFGKKLAQYRPTSEMIAELKRPKRQFGRSAEVSVHARLLRPVLDIALLLLGLPMIVSNSERNIFVSAGLGFLIVGSVFLVDAGCQGLGAYRLLEPAALAAWLPLIIFVPLAFVSMRKLKA
jgi:lipopolysaccharide export system permease protein